MARHDGAVGQALGAVRTCSRRRRSRRRTGGQSDDVGQETPPSTMAGMVRDVKSETLAVTGRDPEFDAEGGT